MLDVDSRVIGTTLRCIENETWPAEEGEEVPCTLIAGHGVLIELKAALAPHPPFLPPDVIELCSEAVVPSSYQEHVQEGLYLRPVSSAFDTRAGMMIDRRALSESLNILASEKEQRRLWLSNNPDEMSLFDEEVCGVFDDSRLDRAIDSGWLSKYCSERFCDEVQRLRTALSKVPSQQPPEIIIDHPSMTVARESARQLLGLLPTESAL